MSKNYQFFYWVIVGCLMWALVPAGLAGTLIVTTTADAGPGSLRQCLLGANANVGADLIFFNIPTTDPGYDAGSGSWKIQPLSALPELTDDGTMIDGTSQANYIGGDPNPSGPEIELDGANAGEADGLYVLSGHNVFKGLVINRFKQFGIQITYDAAQQNTVCGCYIGVDVAGTLSAGNGFSGVIMYNGAKKCVIGGKTLAERNVISGNGWSGVEIQAWEADSNLVIGNFIGTDATGSLALGNYYHGINIWSGAANNIIGGCTPEERNLISANYRNGIQMVGSKTNGNQILGNYIGTNWDGSLALPNGWDGIVTTTKRNVIGGTLPGAGNVIAFNQGSGIVLYHAEENVIAGNFIGVNSSGVFWAGNKFNGIFLSGGSHHNTIGPANIIANNDSSGIQVEQDSTVANTITQNSIFSNGRLGIENCNGGNTELPPPVITLVTASSISGTVIPNGVVEIFSDSTDEGRIYEGTVTADAGGHFTWLGTPAGPQFSATVTDAVGNTSEFSRPFATAIQDQSPCPAPTKFTLHQNYPNPFNPNTQIHYFLPTGSKVKLTIFDACGRAVCTLVNQVQPAGAHSLWWHGLDAQGRTAATGIYLYQIESADFLECRKMLLVK